jgi:hypothetical protein
LSADGEVRRFSTTPGKGESRKRSSYGCKRDTAVHGTLQGDSPHINGVINHTTHLILQLPYQSGFEFQIRNHLQ